VESISQINEDNFEAVFKQYFSPLCNYVNAQIRDWESSREIVQGAFMKIWESRDSIVINTSVKAYLYSTVRNRMIDSIRSNKKLEAYKNSVEATEVIDDDQDLNPHMIREEILASMDKLKPKMKKIFSLSKIEGLTYSEIASYLDVSKRTVEDNVARALTLLRNDLKQSAYLFD